MQLLAADPYALVVGIDRLPGDANYFIGNNPKAWKTNVPTYAKVKYQGVYRGIDLVCYGNQGQLEYDFVVAPGADPGQIALASPAILASTLSRASGAPSMQIDSKGDLLVKVDDGEVRLRKPVVFQPATARRRQTPVEARYCLSRERVTFQLGPYDRSRPLVLDPVLVYSTYIGGSSNDYITGLALDRSGNAYVGGYTTSMDFPTTPGALQTTESGSYDVFVSKLNSTGTALIYSTYLGGTNYQLGIGIAVDSSGDAFVTGFTASTDFPVTPGAYQTQLLGTENDYFVSKLNPAGNGLVYSTYVGQGNGMGAGCCEVLIALGPSGDAYIGGSTDSTAYPVTPGAFQSTYGGGEDVVFTALNAAGSALVYSTFLGGSGYEFVYGMTTDSAGNAYLAGPTDDGGFPVTAGAFQTTYAGGINDGFVAKINPFASGSASLVFATYLGGSGNDETGRLRVDRTGNVYVGGYTDSTNFPVTAGAFQTTYAGNADGFVTKLNPAGSELIYSTYLGGSGLDEDGVFGIDNSGNVYVAGLTTSTDFPTKNAIQSANAGGDDCFITVLNANGSD